MHKKSSKSDKDTKKSSGFDPEIEAKVDALMNTEEVVAPHIYVGDASDSDEHIVILPSAPEIVEPLPESLEDIAPEPNALVDVTSPPQSEETAETEPFQEAKIDIPAEQEDPALDAAVTDITIAESDAVLAADDAKIGSAETVKVPPKKKHRFRGFFASWWRNPIARWATIFLIIAAIAAAIAVPPSRYFLLNTAGARSSASVIVLDETTGQPLQGVTVTIGAQTSKSDETGLAVLSELKLGSQPFVIKRVAFAPIDKTIVVGWGSNPLGERSLTATGAQYVLDATDFLSDKPITNAKAGNGDATAQSDDKGKIVLTIEDPKLDTVTIDVTAEGYRTESITIPSDTVEPQQVKMVPSQPLVYVTKQQGTYDLYKVDADGKNKQELLKGTGSERPYMSLLTNDSGTYTAFVSSREKKYDSERYLLDTLSLVDLKTGVVTKVDQAQSIQLIAWRGDRIVYRAAYAAPSAATNERQRLVSYNVTQAARTVLATGNYFVGIYAVDEYIYYGVSTPGSGEEGAFARVKVDDSGKKVLLSGPVWTVNQTKPDELYINSNDTWYSYNTTANSLSKQQVPQDTYLSPQYYMAPGKQYGVLVEQRDGQGVLVFTEKEKTGDTLANARRIHGPIAWLNDTTLSYYADTGSETAQYVVNIQGGEPMRVSAVTLVSGASAGYYD